MTVATVAALTSGDIRIVNDLIINKHMFMIDAYY